jgi:hypothetical protein
MRRAGIQIRLKCDVIPLQQAFGPSLCRRIERAIERCPQLLANAKHDPRKVIDVYGKEQAELEQTYSLQQY